ncbi:cytochrome d ubiquinol oxidase subunit II [Ilumatobacter coccineus]|jgi:cytochrome bd ubiquinol oxidase subunit II|uniref:Putative cytochrome bd-I oxidase subunit II n=1 Tax=Ilumatobacter coccineus (strain NBRC 103263 / KCTC 29153 / YM16-304) TaxID=1313172 RepID=A0A6C7ECJ0_ILUCY|nr:cytochrome d ubiquinol oxidase subunit II [Ilumatobacter coccineus]BAN01726.1 putative cytochrome bd-I oxidase subunit II [Ilumatobacter coccineus YM16-304]
MGLSDIVAGLMFVGVVAYALFGGADFGSGVWDLTAGDAESGAPLRSQIDRSIGPVWEANHVWLIYILVFLWTGFPTAFAAIMNTLFIPWLLVGLGIVLRGGAFAFRKFASTLREAQIHGAVFAASSLITPFFLGMIAGAIASGRVPLDGSGDVWTSWTGPTSWVGGALAVLTCTFLAGTFLAADAHRAGNTELAERVGTTALFVGAITGGAALVAAVTLEIDAEHLASGLHGRGLPLIAISAVAGSFSLLRLRQQRWDRARVGATIAVASIVVGWGVGQYPAILVDHADIDDVIGARPTQVGLLVVFGLAAVTVVPALAWLYVLVNGKRWARTH